MPSMSQTTHAGVVVSVLTLLSVLVCVSCCVSVCSSLTVCVVAVRLSVIVV